MTDFSTYTPQDVEQAMEMIRASEDFPFKREGRAILLYGQPAAGKSRIASLYIQYPTYKEIDGDTFRSYHPHYMTIQQTCKREASKYTGAFAGEVCERVIAESSRSRENLLIHGTGRNYDTIQRTVQTLRHHGYDTVDMVIVTCPLAMSVYSIYERYFKEYDPNNRFTDLDHVKLVLRNLPKNIERASAEKLVDSICLVHRHGEEIALENNRPGKALRQNLMRPLRPDEEAGIAEIQALIRSIMKEQAADEIATIDALIEELQQEILADMR